MRAWLERASGVHVLRWMGWVLPNSPGHYLDLLSAILGVGLLIGAGIKWLLKIK